MVGRTTGIMMLRANCLAYLSVAALLVAGCAPSEKTHAEKVDPAIAAALDVPLMTDPDLVTQNARFAAVEVDPLAPASGSKPVR